MATSEEFELPEALLEMLPTDPYQLLDLGSKITSMAVTSHLSKSDKEIRKLRQKLAEKEHLIHSLQGRNQELEKSLESASSRLSTALNEQAKLATEKKNLSTTVRRLSHGVQKLETFKKTLIQSLQDQDDIPYISQDDNEGLVNHQNVSPSRGSFATSSRDNLNQNKGAASLKYLKREEESEETSDEDSLTETDGKISQRVTPSSSQRGTPRELTPGLTPSASPRRQSSTIASPRLPSHIGDFRVSTSSTSNTPSSRESLPGQSIRVDGKEFFRHARSRLSYEQFSAFLNNIKELNSHRQTKEEALQRAEELFGPENQDLYRAFSGLLSRHLSS